MTSNKNYQRAIPIKASRNQVFEAITKNISKWWTENYAGSADAVGDEFTVRFNATFKVMKISSKEANKHILWTCIDQHIEMPPGIAPLKNNREWVGTTITWQMEDLEVGCLLSHTHIGLTPAQECWGVCETGWDQTLKSLVNLLETGKGMPFYQLDQEHLDRALEHERKFRQ